MIHAEDYERTCTMGILTLRKFQGFLYFKEMTAEPQQNRKTASLKSFVSAGIHADEIQYYIPGSTTQSFIFHSRTPFY